MNNQKRTDSALQRFVAPYVPLINVDGTGVRTAVADFEVPIPDARLRTKVSLMFNPPAGTPLTVDLTAGSGLIWLYEGEKDESGVSGVILPAANISGTQAAPLAIPVAAGLYGYSREFVTLADKVRGHFAFGTFAHEGTWGLQVTYCPDSVRFTPDEWDVITQSCNPTRVGPVGIA